VREKKRASFAPLLWAALPAAGGLAVLFVFLALFYRTALRHTAGNFCYPLDDTFIHMAIARNIALHGTFGLVPKVFAAASSSIAWPLILALFDRVIGDRLMTPFALNLLFAIGAIIVLARAFERGAPKATPTTRMLWIIATVIVIPLPTVVYTGMEHAGHIFVMLLLLFEAAEWLASDRATPSRRLVALALLATLFRYESLFIGGIIAFAAVLRRRYRVGGAVLLASVAPVVLFGVYSMAHGGLFLPTSVVVKGNRMHFHDLSDVGDALGGDFVERMAIEPHMLATLAVSAIVLVVALAREGLWSKHSLRIGIALLTGIAHTQFASLNWFFRYEAYVVAMCVASVGIFCADLVPSIFQLVRMRKLGPPLSIAALLATVLSFAALGRRALFAAEQTPSAARNIYDQQVQNARFLKRYFPREPVAVNDIGAVAYYGEHPLVDLGGLATLDVARAKHFDFYQPPSADAIASLTAQTNVAIVYDAWFPRSLPKTWVLAGRWQLDWCRVCASPVVSIYATRPEAFGRVIRALREFAPNLPSDVRQEGRYVQRPVARNDHAAFVEGDVLRVEAPFESPTLRARYSYVVVVRPDGRFDYPFSAPIRARGLDLTQIAAKIHDAFDEIRTHDHELLEPTPPITVSVVRRAAIHYAVVGNVFAPNEYWCDEPRPAARALQLAGGRDFGSTHATPFILREREDGHFDRIPFDPSAPDGGPMVGSYDVVYVP
jgi:hypothetical protein